MGIDRLPLLMAALLLASSLAFGSAIAQTDENKNGATGELPQSRSPGRSFQLTPLPPEPNMDELEGGEDEPPSAQTCPDRGNNLELII